MTGSNIGRQKLESLAPESFQRLVEATYFLQQMVINYHDPVAFRFNLNATVQAIRNVTFVLQAELSSNEVFKKWYTQRQSEMRSNELLRRFVEARNIIVKEKSLEARSTASVGLFVYTKLKIWIQQDVCPSLDSRMILEKASSFVGLFVDQGHSAEWEQAGVCREWIMEELGDGEVVSLCNRAIDYIGMMFVDLAQVTDHEFSWFAGNIRDLSRHRVLLETDVDSSLPYKWGWLK